MADRSELSLFRCAAGLTALEVVRLLKPHFPLIDKTVISKAEHGDLYGVELNRKAWEILKEAYPVACNKAKNKAQKRKADRHKKTRRLSVRLSEDRFLELQQRMQAEGLTAQEFLERELERIATAPFGEPRNDGGSVGGADGSGAPGGERVDRRLWRRKGDERVAAVEKIEDQRKPEVFFRVPQQDHALRECQQQPPCVPPLKGGGLAGGADGLGVPGGHALRITAHNAPGWQHRGPLVIAPTGADGGADG